MKAKPFVGIWLDHREAYLCWADEQGEMDTQRVESEYQEEGEPADRASPGGVGVSGAGVPHASVERRRKEQLNHYYKRLVRALRAAREVYLFGPGQAKRELARAIEQHKDLSSSLKGVESAQTMTRRQMAARVRGFFKLPRGPAA